jgi:hypothetical protein
MKVGGGEMHGTGARGSILSEATKGGRGRETNPDVNFDLEVRGHDPPRPVDYPSYALGMK